jgi:D-amino-acid dehydrogenase
VISADEAVKIEPALAHIRPKLAGATYTSEDESGDANRFARELVQRCEQDGVQFLMSHTVTALRSAGGEIDHVEATDHEGRFRRLRADAYVVAMGSLSPLLVKPLGIELPIYPAKGYSVTLPVGPQHVAPNVSLTDDEYKIVFSRLGDRLRCAGTAELNGYDTELNETRCRAIVDRMFTLFPEAGDRSQVRYWTGLRPATPSNVPLIGRSRIPNLYLDTGHGTLGWTHACGSGKAIADIVSGRAPEVDFAFLGAPARKRVTEQTLARA